VTECGADKIYMEHAKLESEVNCDAAVAERVLMCARDQYPACARDPIFVCTLVKLLASMGNLQQIRWIMQCALEASSDTSASLQCSTVGSNGIESDASAVSKAHSQQSNPYGGNSKMVGSGLDSLIELRNELILREEYLRIETVLGISDLKRLHLLRVSRDQCRQTFENLQRSKIGAIISSRDGLDDSLSSSSLHKYASDGVTPSGLSGSIFESAAEIAERYSNSVGSVLGESDRAMVHRCLGEYQPHLLETTVNLVSSMGPGSGSSSSGGSGLSATAHNSMYIPAWSGGALGALLRPHTSSLSQQHPSGAAGNDLARVSGGNTWDLVDGRQSGGKSERDAATGNSGSNMSTEFLLSMAGLPLILRDLLTKLPLYTGTPLNSDGFIRHMRGVVMPPRPAVEETAVAAVSTNDMEIAAAAAAEAAAAGDRADDGNDDDDLVASATVKIEPGMGGNPHIVVFAAQQLNEDGASAVAAEGEDIFRQRRRAKKA
jgi:hypothetical protein